MSVRTLALLGGLELATLVVLVVNLATVHLPVVATILGPLHGLAYLAAIVGSAVLAGPVAAPTLLSLVPGVGATLAAAVLRRRARSGDAAR